jgi:peptidoglycan/LPS O-acetylase OafA/YrhL
LSSTTIVEGSVTSSPVVAQVPAKTRLEFLDALRGIAATAVLLQHSAENLWPSYYQFSEVVIRPGEWGVFVFFMISGFVIPLSLKNETDAIGFWIGRIFRLFPLYWVVVVGAFVLATWHIMPVPESFNADPTQNFIVNLTMVQEFLATPQLVGAAWSLAYEVCFYLFMTLMLLAGLTRSATKSTIVCLAGSASLGLLIYPTFIMQAESVIHSGLVALAIVVVTLTALWGRVKGALNKALAVVVTFALVGLVLNQPRDLWFSLLLFATMGCGWVYNEANSGRVDRWVPVAVSAGTVLVFTLQFYFWADPVTSQADVLTAMAAHGAFFLAYLIRKRQMPAALVWLGTVSYSIYLIHAVVINTVPEVSDQPVVALLFWVAVTLAISHVSFRLIELPAQRLGRTLRRRARQTLRPVTAA